MSKHSILLILLLILPACVSRPAPTVELAQANANVNDDEEIGWLCPMHPDHTSEVPGTCPRCGMKLVQGTLFDMRDYHLNFHTVPEQVKAGEKATLMFSVSHPGTGERIKQFELTHDRPYHLFVISQDMEYFQHIHPQEGEDGTWSIEVTLPKEGYYSLLSDFLPAGGSSQFLTQPLVTAGYKGDLMTQAAHLVPDEFQTQTVDGLTATVQYDPDVMRAGSYSHITFNLSRNGTPVRELQTYLGAFGHMLIMTEDMVDYVHSHPVDMLPTDQPVEELRGGPTVMFEGLMPKPGRYRAWTQFRLDDKIYTFTNTFEVLDVGIIR
jgi:hypothetical protein